MNIDWQHYHAPNKEAIEEIPTQLDYLFSANDSSENIEYFLYNELAPNIKHQFKIYNVIEPVIEVIECNILQEGKTQYKNEILNFLGYIFQEFIRDENKRFQFFVKSVFTDNIETQSPEVIFYKSALNNNQKTFETLIHHANLQNIREILFACGLMSFKNPNLKIHDLNITTQQDGITNLGFCINGMEFDKELAITSLSIPKQQSFVWGNGYECVLATSAMMIDSLHKNARYQKNTINHIMNGYDTIRKINIDEDFNFPPHKFMLEDLSSILFHEYLGKGILIDKKMLTEAQLYFYNLMTEEFCTHTYSLLYAGIMPEGMSIESANNIDDIYNCYN